jgi:hypothetical protein
MDPKPSCGINSTDSAPTNLNLRAISRRIALPNAHHDMDNDWGLGFSAGLHAGGQTGHSSHKRYGLAYGMNTNSCSCSFFNVSHP